MSFIISCLTNSYGRFGARGAIECLPKAGIDFVESHRQAETARQMVWHWRPADGSRLRMTEQIDPILNISEKPGFFANKKLVDELSH